LRLGLGLSVRLLVLRLAHLFMLLAQVGHLHLLLLSDGLLLTQELFLLLSHALLVSHSVLLFETLALQALLSQPFVFGLKPLSLLLYPLLLAHELDRHLLLLSLDLLLGES
jgi:hypothetical protein